MQGLGRGPQPGGILGQRPLHSSLCPAPCRNSWMMAGGFAPSPAYGAPNALLGQAQASTRSHDRSKTEWMMAAPPFQKLNKQKLNKRSKAYKLTRKRMRKQVYANDQASICNAKPKQVELRRQRRNRPPKSSTNATITPCTDLNTSTVQNDSTTCKLCVRCV